MGDNISEKIQDLVKYLNERTKEYDEGHPTISDEEWDSKYFELKELESKTGIILSDSPTQAIIYETVNSLEKVKHNHLMLSLEKTKEIEEVKRFLGDKTCLAMCKMDGLTCSLRYVDGKLVSAETRGNGIIGENILHNAMVIPSIPKRISYKEELIVDGEIICTTADFEEFADKYKNSRNFASGSIRLLSAKECETRHLTFVAWDVISDMDNLKTLAEKLTNLAFLGFIIVPFTKGAIQESIDELTVTAKAYGYPIDGIVFKFNDIEYGKSLGQTSHHFKNAIAFKFYDDTTSSRLTGIEWTMGRTGVLTPVAQFEPIDMDGSVVSRASLHNISIMTELLGDTPYITQPVEVFKANMIIPQIASADKRWNGIQDLMLDIPKVCPVCGKPTEVQEDNNSKILVCTNANCEGKLINRLDHFCGKKGLDIKGLSKATLQKLIDWEWVKNYTDIFELRKYADEWKKKAGFGEKSVENVLAAIDGARHCELNSFICAIGIPLIGSTASKELVKYFNTWNDFINAIETGYHFWDIPNFGFEMHSSIVSFNYNEAKELFENYLDVNSVNKDEEVANNSLDGISIVITGKLVKFKNRAELQTIIEKCGGKVVGSISSKTSYLINNDVSSETAKNVAAKKLGIPILSEEDFIKTFGLQG